MEQLRVNTGFAGIYKEAEFSSELVSQVLLWEKLIVLTRKKEFFFVRAEDGYQGWVHNEQVVSYREETDFTWRVISILRGNISEEPDIKSSPIRDFSIGSHIPVLESQTEWSHVLLPDGITGWLQNEAINEFPCHNRMNCIQLAHQFLGIPYLWGGKSGSGLDCSGLTQLVHKLIGIHTRRDAWMQFEDARSVSESINDANPGDLFFFSEEGSKITHVGIALGDGRILHARGHVRINSLIPGRDHFDEKLRDNFISVKTFFSDELAPKAVE